MARTKENILYWDQIDRSQRERVAAWLGDRIHDMSAEEEQIAETEADALEKEGCAF